MCLGKFSFFIGIENKFQLVFSHVLCGDFSPLLLKMSLKKIFSLKDEIERSGAAGHTTIGPLVLWSGLTPHYLGFCFIIASSEVFTAPSSPYPCLVSHPSASMPARVEEGNRRG